MFSRTKTNNKWRTKMEAKEKVVVEIEEKSGEELLNEYIAQDEDYTRSMGYGVYSQTQSGGCC